MKKKVAVLGATGSIGTCTLDLIRNCKDHNGNARFEPVLFSARKNAEALELLKKEFPNVMTVLGKEELLKAISIAGAEITVNGISGAAGLEPSIAAIMAGSDLALANKETIVLAGHIILGLAEEKNVRIIPVDSEHSALFKLIHSLGKTEVSELILTASGGPFRNYSMEALSQVTAEQALSHPTWNMGPKITIDSATLANKGLEVIEAAFLFGFPPEKIKVTIHPQSIVHSMVRLKNGAVYAQMSQPDMRLPIHDALFWPECESSAYGSLDFDSLFLSFEKPDLEKFPMLKLAYKVLQGPSGLPVVYNAANEIAVEAFLQKKIGFLEIPRLVSYVVDNCLPGQDYCTIEGILALDEKSRKITGELINCCSNGDGEFNADL